MANNPPTNEKVTIKDIARIAKVSPSTVSMVINDRPGVGEDTRYRVLRIVEALNFTPNLVARSLVKRHSKSIAMFITNPLNPIFPEIAGGMDEVLKKLGYSLNIISTYDDERLETKEIETVKARGIDGIITSAALLGSKNIPGLVDSGFPVVSVLRRVYGCDDLDFVIVNDVKGGYLAAEHLIRLGHKRIAIIKGPTNTSTGVERFEGAVKAFQDYGATLSKDLVQQGDFFKESGYSATKALLKSNAPPTAIYACNDDMALGAFEAVWDMNLKIPRDVALIGFNDVETTSLRSIEITTIGVRKYELGTLGAKRLIDKIEKNKGYKRPLHVILDPQLIIRRSCGYSMSSRYVVSKAKRRQI